MNKSTIKVILILIMISYIFYLVWNANSLSCNQCTVTLNNKGFKTTYNMSDLFNQTKLNECPIYWDRVQGYVKG